METILNTFIFQFSRISDDLVLRFPLIDILDFFSENNKVFRVRRYLMLTILNRSHENVIGIEASEIITESDIEEIVPHFDALIEKYGKINWLIIIKTSRYATLRAMYADLMWLIKNLKHFDRMAIVGDKKWEELVIKPKS